MTILDMLNNRNQDNKLMEKGFEIIKDNYTNYVNDNYELIVNEKGELNIKIPSVEKKNEYVYKGIGEYKYPLVMCMRISEIKNVEEYEHILTKFMELYKDKLELFVKDVHTVDKLMDKIKETKDYIDNITYVSIGTIILCLISVCIFSSMSPMVKNVLVLGVILFFGYTLFGQFTKEQQVKKIIDGYISSIKTEWYKKELIKGYVFLCNFME